MAQSLVARSPMTAFEARMMLQRIKLENMGIARIASTNHPSTDQGSFHVSNDKAAGRFFPKTAMPSFVSAAGSFSMSSFAQPAQVDPDE